MERPTCPADDELLRWIDRDPGVAGLQGHIEDCPSCRAHLARLEAAARALHRFAATAVQSNGASLVPLGSPGMQPGGETATPAEDSSQGRGDEATAKATAEPMPTAIGKYPVVGILGRGGQAVVYRGIHPTLGVDVAIKVGLRPRAIDWADPGELVREAKALAELDHPNLVRVYDLDVDAAGRPFLVMELVRGNNLRQYAERVRPDPRAAATLLAAVTRGVAAAHRKNLTHLDIKPENILIDEAGRPRLIDFGLVRLRDAWTQEAGPSGATPKFVAPEQARGEDAGARSDVFALGGVLYFLLTGLAPFAGRDRAEEWGRARRCDFDRSALRAANAPRLLERICLRAMAAEPADRHASAEELADDLERFGRRPHRLLSLVTAAAVLLTALGLGLTFHHRGGGNPNASPRGARTGPGIQPPGPSGSLGSGSGLMTSAPAVTIDALNVELHRRSLKKSLGMIGRDVFAGRYEDDDVRVSARLSAPAYAYLIALNTDGTEQLYHPQERTIPPSPSAQINSPRERNKGFGLTDGVGLQVIILVSSRHPLPSYESWLASVGDLSWQPAADSRGWRYDGWRFESLEQERGKSRTLTDPSPPLGDVCQKLQDGPGIDAIRAVAFPVKLSNEGPPRPLTKDDP